MSETKELAEEIVLYLARLNVKQKKEVLSVVKSFAIEESTRNDKSFHAEIKRRFEELESGAVKPITIEELTSQAKRSFKNRPRKVR